MSRQKYCIKHLSDNGKKYANCSILVMRRMYRRRNGRKSCCAVSNIVFAELIYGTRSSEKRNWISDDLVDRFRPAVYHEYRLYIVESGASPVNLPYLIRTIYYRR